MLITMNKVIMELYYFAPAAEPFHEVVTPWQREFSNHYWKEQCSAILIKMDGCILPKKDSTYFIQAMEIPTLLTMAVLA
jgi:hypothetical protein